MTQLRGETIPDVIVELVIFVFFSGTEPNKSGWYEKGGRKDNEAVTWEEIEKRAILISIAENSKHGRLENLKKWWNKWR